MTTNQESEGTMARTTIMVIGIGDLGGHVLELLARAPGSWRFIAVGRTPDRLVRKANIALFGAAQQGYYPRVEHAVADLNRIDQAAETIYRYKPEIIFNAATLQSWWVINALPREIFERLDRARYGPWLPMHLTLVHKLMQAVKQTGLDVRVINAAFPDAVHPVLQKVHLAPTVGIGNVANPIPALRCACAAYLGRPMRDVQLFFVAHHFVSHYLPRFGNAGGAPYYLRVVVDGEDVTAELDVAKVFADLPTRFCRVGGREGQILTASSAAEIILAMAEDRGVLTHAPGPLGMPGGYPVRVDGEGVRVALPRELSLKDATRINEEGQRFDGIDQIAADGTVTFTPRAAGIMNEMLGYDCRAMSLGESEARAVELSCKVKELLRKCR
jgi:hypothetical protein